MMRDSKIGTLQDLADNAIDVSELSGVSSFAEYIDLLNIFL